MRLLNVPFLLKKHNFYSGSSESDEKGSDESHDNHSQHSMNMLDNYIDHYGELNYAYIIDNE